MKYYVIAGEASGDVHASKLMQGIVARDANAEFRCWGGEKMESAGGRIVKHYKDLAFMGFLEVILNLRTISANLRFCKNDILKWKPDAIILVDYPGFNMRIAKFAKKNGFKVFYYIAPQVWAWKKHRVHAIHRDTDLAFVVMPFEKDFYASFGYDVAYVGHPMPDSIDLTKPINTAEFRFKNKLSEKPIIAILPGSRKQELHRILPHMLGVIGNFPDYQFVIAGVNSLGSEFYQKIVGVKPVNVVFGQTHNLLRMADAAIVTSGTATLETALLNVPQVVCYRMSFLTAIVAWMLVNVKYISLVNLILDKGAVKELIQYKFTSATLTKELTPLLKHSNSRLNMLADYDLLREKIGNAGASDRAAALIMHKILEVSSKK